MKVKKRKLLQPFVKSNKSLNELIKKAKLKNKIISVWDMKVDLKKALKYERTKKIPLIYPKIKYYSQSDKYEKYPYYYYLIEDIAIYIKIKSS